MDANTLAHWRAQWLAEEQAHFQGWDFGYLRGRLIEDTPPWDYQARAATLMEQTDAALDMETGGGEFLLRLHADWPRKLVATEGYPPNVALAWARLTPLGATVVEAKVDEDRPMPFADGEFGLALNRHGGFNASEVARILAPGGTFLTQQVHGWWAADLLAHFGAQPEYPHATLENAIVQVASAGLELIRAQDWVGSLMLLDVGAVVYYLKAIPWLVPGFSVARHFDRLVALQRQLDEGGELVFEDRLYLIEARKPV